MKAAETGKENAPSTPGNGAGASYVVAMSLAGQQLNTGRSEKPTYMLIHKQHKTSTAYYKTEYLKQT